MEGQKSELGSKIFVFEIGKNTHWKRYQFNLAARSVAALCVLYDLENHPRNHLELTWLVIYESGYLKSKEPTI